MIEVELLGSQGQSLPFIDTCGLCQITPMYEGIFEVPYSITETMKLRIKSYLIKTLKTSAPPPFFSISSENYLPLGVLA